MPWKKANLTTYESYPTSDKEASDYNGDKWRGYFAFIDGKKSKDWVEHHAGISDYGIAAVAEQDKDPYKDKYIEIIEDPSNDKEIPLIAKIIDYGSDKDTKNNDVTKNRNRNGTNFLIDLEKNTAITFYGRERYKKNEMDFDQLAHKLPSQVYFRIKEKQSF